MEKNRWAREYINDLERRGCGTRTIENNRRYVKRIMLYFNEKGVKNFGDIALSDIEGFVKWAGGGNLTEESKKARGDAAAQFVNFLSKRISGRPLLKSGEKPAALTANYPPGFMRYYEEYALRKRIENIPENTLKKSLGSVRIFYNYLLEERKIDDLTKVTKDDVKEYSIYLSEKNWKPASGGERRLSPESVSRYLCGLKGYLIWLSKRGVCCGMAVYIRKIRRNERISRNILTRKEISRLFEVKAMNAAEFMMKTVIVILYSSGARSGEILSLKLNDIDSTTGEAVIYESKTGKERKVILGSIGTKYLKLYIDCIRDKITYGETGGKLFVSKREGKTAWGATVNVYLKKFCGRAGIKKLITCHCFRHSYGTHLLENGAGIKQVSELLGHDSLKSTEKYTHLNPEHLRQTILKYHPMESVRVAASRDASQ
jgi:integrase/recombinase XerD